MRSGSLAVVLTLALAGVAAAEPIELKHTGISLEVAGWTAGPSDDEYSVDRVVDEAGNSLEVRLGGRSCPESWLAIGLTRSDAALPDGYALATVADGTLILCLEVKDVSVLVAMPTPPGEVPAVKEMLVAIATAAVAAKGAVRPVPARFRFSKVDKVSLALDPLAWKVVSDPVSGVFLVETRPDGLGWSVRIGEEEGTCNFDSVIGATTETPPWLPFGAPRAFIVRKDGRWRADFCVDRREYTRVITISVLREPTDDQIETVVAELLGAIEISKPRPVLAHVLFGAMIASSKGTDDGAERGSGFLFALEAAGQEGRYAGAAFDFGVDLGYTYHGLAAELRGAGGGGVRLGPVGLSLCVGGLLSLLGEDGAPGDFTRHAGGLATARLLVRGGRDDRAGFSLAVTQTKGKNADQLRIEAWASSRPLQVGVRWIEHGEFGEPAVARTVMVAIGLGM